MTCSLNREMLTFLITLALLFRICNVFGLSTAFSETTFSSFHSPVLQFTWKIIKEIARMFRYYAIIYTAFFSKLPV